MRQVPGIASAVVTAPEDNVGHRSLVAWLVRQSDRPKPDQAKIAAILLQTLPRHMVPARMIWLDALPLSANGKVGRTALPQPDNPIAAPPIECSMPARLPAGRIETGLVRMWSELFGRAVAVSGDYFALGGDSLAAFDRVDRCDRHFGCDLSVEAPFERPSIAQLAFGQLDQESAFTPADIHDPAKTPAVD